MVQVKAIIEGDCGGRSMDSIFSTFDPVPVGAASIAQAHRATLKDGSSASCACHCACVCADSVYVLMVVLFS